HRTKQEQDISVWPDNPMGSGAEGAKFRFQWTYPILVSKYDPKTLYVTANVVFKSINEGMSWTQISGDLTRDDTSKLHSSGGPITKDNTSVEYYATIFTFAESPVDKNVLWSGSDDGLVQVTKDGGASWQNVTPGDLPPWSMMSIIDASPYDPGTAYFAANRYKLDDFTPYLFKTTDYGKSWKKIVNGIPEGEFTHVIRADPNRKGLLYAGTERGIYCSFNDGESWQPLQINLPVTPVHDIAIQAKEKDLIVATHGRAFWILDDLTPIYQLNDKVVADEVHLFKPRDTYRIEAGSFERPGMAVGSNPPSGALIYYYFKNKPKAKDSVKVDILDSKGTLVKSFAGKSTKDDAPKDDNESDDNENPTAPADSGMNRFIWNMHYPDAVKVPGAIMWAGTTDGPLAVPGTYQVRLTVAGKSWTEPFELKVDPRITTSQADLQEQFDFLIKIRDKVTEADETVNNIRDIKKQTGDFVKKLDKQPYKKTVADSSKSLNDKLTKIENEIIQTKIKADEDALNFPIKLNDKIAGLIGVVSSADTKPTKQSYDVYTELSAQLDAQIAKYKKVLETDLPAFDETVKKLDIPAVILKPSKESGGGTEKK
ncbi:MAG TPA: glycosyl hydrolase, partial [Bacteroidota bacterium]|nr:glycosyl hydrolase [Bacteroidota bacterium]